MPGTGSGTSPRNRRPPRLDCGDLKAATFWERRRLAPQRRAALRELHATGIAAYRAREWAAAGRAFDAALQLYPDDGPAAVYRQRCKVLKAKPPPEDWDGVWNLTEK